MRKISVVTLVLLALAGLATAQVPKGNIFAGYSYLNATAGGPDRSTFNGWNGSLEGKLFPFVGIVADVSGHYGSVSTFATSANPTQVPDDGRLLTAAFGPRVSFSVGKIRPFVEALFGVSHLRVDCRHDCNFFVNPGPNTTSFASVYGGGLDYHLVPFLAWRVEGDALRTTFGNGTQNNFRLSTGLVFNF